MRVVAIIQARMGSTRLPGKVLADLGGATVLARVVNRTRGATTVDEVEVATSIQTADDAIVKECMRLSVGCFRGDETDVLDRYYRAAQNCGAEAIVRITADCPLIEPELIDKTVNAFLDHQSDYATNSLIVTYPRGLDVEVFTWAALVRAWHEAKEFYQRVHVTPYIYQNPQLFRLFSLTSESDDSQYRWTLDTAEDLEIIRAIYVHFGNRVDFHWRDVTALMDREPDLAELNAHIRQKTLHEG
ncbi:MAG: acylneuraminate cytidylyltransferase [Acidobacteria bacterium]|nr:MAG: acylneuraminate cytidylyltransferase [Acidobacteriota bacterium]PYX65553.1 MAG: acylneuraminate cytidylyltransferase [Acidobacteriota bacterium]